MEGLGVREGLGPAWGRAVGRGGPVGPFGVGAGGPLGGGGGGGGESEALAEAVQERANQVFRELFARPMEMSVEDFVELVGQMRDSQEPMDRRVHECIVNNLFSEWEYLGEYPPTELGITAQAYGGLIRGNVVSGHYLPEALHLVLLALGAEPHSLLFRFGLTALEAFALRLPSFPSYSKALAALPTFPHFPPLIQQAIFDSLPPEPHQAHHHALGHHHPGQQYLGRTERLGPVEVGGDGDGAPVVPPEEVQEAASFRINNLTMEGVEAAGMQMWREVLFCRVEWAGWLSGYLVETRVMKEPNLHQLYAAFVFGFPEAAGLVGLVMGASLGQAEAILGQPSPGEAQKAQLKTLGAWLGLITIARNRAFPRKQLDLKGLLREARDPEARALVLPFAAKILRAAAQSQIFGPSHPWTAGILHELVRAHGEDLKLNLKFEVEVLCRDLKVSLESLSEKVREQRHSSGDESAETIHVFPPDPTMSFSPLPSPQATAPPPPQPKPAPQPLKSPLSPLSRDKAPLSADFRRRVDAVFRLWLDKVGSTRHARDPKRGLQELAVRMKAEGMLHSDDVFTDVLRVSAELVIDSAQTLIRLHPDFPQRHFVGLDAFVQLFFAITSGLDTQERSRFFTRTLGILCARLEEDVVKQGKDFEPLPFTRLFYLLQKELSRPDVGELELARSLADAFRRLRPARLPSFAFAFLQLVGAPHFLRLLRKAQDPVLDSAYVQLVVDMLHFLAPFIIRLDMPGPVAQLHRGLLRLVTLLVHDFPDLLLRHAHRLCDAVPSNAVQLRNLVLSPFPSHLPQPDPNLFPPDAPVADAPDVPASFLQRAEPFKDLMAEALAQWDQPESPALRELVVKVADSSPGLFTGLVLRLAALETVDGTEAPEEARTALFVGLALGLSSRDRYVLLNAMGNELVWPQRRSLLFSRLLVALFGRAELAEGVARMLMERVVGKTPAPWAVRHTLARLFREPRHDLLAQPFVRADLQLYTLFYRASLFYAPASAHLPGPQPQALPQPPLPQPQPQHPHDPTPHFSPRPYSFPNSHRPQPEPQAPH